MTTRIAIATATPVIANALSAPFTEDELNPKAPTKKGTFAGLNTSPGQALGKSHALEAPVSPSKRKLKGSALAPGEKPHASSFYVPPDEAGIRKYLAKAGWPRGLQQAVIDTAHKIPIRYFITDDSGSMLTNDGHRLVGSGPKTKFITCSRWSELTESMRFHAGLAEAGRIPSEFRLLNNAEPILVGRGEDGGVNLQLCLQVFDESPGGQTPLCQQITEVIESIRKIIISISFSLLFLLLPLTNLDDCKLSDNDTSIFNDLISSMVSEEGI